MRVLARARLKYLLGLAVAVGLVTLLSPIPFTSSTPRHQNLSSMRSHGAPNPFNAREEARQKDRGGNRRIEGVYAEDSGVYSEKEPGNHKISDRYEKEDKIRERTVGKKDLESVYKENGRRNDEIREGNGKENEKKERKEFYKEKEDVYNENGVENPVKSEGNGKENVKNARTKENKVIGRVDKEYKGEESVRIGVNAKPDGARKRTLKNKEKEAVLDEYAVNLNNREEEGEEMEEENMEEKLEPPEGFVEVMKINPKERGDRGGGGGDGREGEERVEIGGGGREGLKGQYREGEREEEIGGGGDGGREELKEGSRGERKNGEEGKVGGGGGERRQKDGRERGKNELEGKEGIKGRNKNEIQDKRERSKEERGSKGGKATKERKGGKKKRKKTPKKDLVKPIGLSPKELQERVDSLPQDSPVRAFLTEQSRRVAHVAQSCRSFNPSLAEIVAGSRGPPTGLLAVRDIVFDRSNQLTFCPVYKAASTSWLITLLSLGGHWTPYTQRQPLQKVVKMFYPKLSGLAAASITSNTTHFMIVRHPLERLLSCYRDKFQHASKEYYYHMYGEKMVRQYRVALRSGSREEVLALQEEVRLALIRHRKKYGEGVGEGNFLDLPHNPFANPVGPTFPEFAQYVADTHYDDEHWRTYHAHCAPCTLIYDFVLRFESLQEETLSFLDYLNRTGDVAPRWDNHDKRKADTAHVSCQYYSQLPLEIIDKLITKYRKDLTMYEYDAEEYRRCAEDYRSSDGGGGDGGSGGDGGKKGEVNA